MERTLIIVKPDGVQRGLTGEIIRRLETPGLRIVGMKFMRASRELAAEHYKEHVGKSFYPGLLDYITSTPVVVMALEGPRAVDIARAVIGKTDPLEAVPGTIRSDLALMKGRNLVHGSDSVESAERELALWFRPEELISWERDGERWLVE